MMSNDVVNMLNEERYDGRSCCTIIMIVLWEDAWWWCSLCSSPWFFSLTPSLVVQESVARLELCSSREVPMKVFIDYCWVWWSIFGLDSIHWLLVSLLLGLMADFWICFSLNYFLACWFHSVIISRCVFIIMRKILF